MHVVTGVSTATMTCAILAKVPSSTAVTLCSTDITHAKHSDLIAALANAAIQLPLASSRGQVEEVLCLAGVNDAVRSRIDTYYRLMRSRGAL